MFILSFLFQSCLKKTIKQEEIGSYGSFEQPFGQNQIVS